MLRPTFVLKPLSWVKDPNDFDYWVANTIFGEIHVYALFHPVHENYNTRIIIPKRPGVLDFPGHDIDAGKSTAQVLYEEMFSPAVERVGYYDSDPVTDAEQSAVEDAIRQESAMDPLSVDEEEPWWEDDEE